MTMKETIKKYDQVIQVCVQTAIDLGYSSSLGTRAGHCIIRYGIESVEEIEKLDLNRIAKDHPRCFGKKVSEVIAKLKENFDVQNNLGAYI